jgi:hypothetical protein
MISLNFAQNLAVDGDQGTRSHPYSQKYFEPLARILAPARKRSGV